MAYKRFSADNAAMLLIDHQVGTIEWMHSAPKKDVIRDNRQSQPQYVEKHNLTTGDHHDYSSFTTRTFLIRLREQPEHRECRRIENHCESRALKGYHSVRLFASDDCLAKGEGYPRRRPERDHG